LSRKTCLALTLVFLTTSVAAQPDMPHRVYGNITDEVSGEPVEVNVSIRNSSVLASGSSSSDGFYDLRFTASEGEKVFLFAQNSNTSESTVFEAGSSEEINYAGDFDIDEIPEEPENPDDSNDTEDNNTEDDNTDDQEDETDTGGSGSSGGGGGGGSLPGFGEDDNETQNESEDEGNDGGSLAPPNTKNIDVTLEGYTDVSIGNVKQNQHVVVNVRNGDTLRGLEFTAGTVASDVSLRLADSRQPLSGVSIDSGEAFAYIDMEISGINNIYNTDLSVKVPTSWIDSRDREASEMDIARYSRGWKDRTLSYVSRDTSNYIFSSDFEPGDYVVYMPQEKEKVSNINVDSFDVEEVENTSRVRLRATITNSGTGSGEKNVPIYANDEVIENRTVSLGPGESMNIDFETEIDEETTFSMQGQERVADAPEKTSMSLYAVLAGAVIALLVLVAVLKYMSEQRQARRMEREIAGIRNREQKVEDRMKSLRENVENLRKRLD